MFVSLTRYFLLAVSYFVVLAGISPSALAISAAEYGVVLNLSGKQRMLTQKMSKEVTLVALGVDAEQNIKNLSATSDLFDRTLKGLRDGDAELGLPSTESKRIVRQLDKVDGIWAEFYPVIKDVIGSGAVTQDQLSLIAEKNLPLLKQMNKAVGLYEKDAKKNGTEASPGLATTINLAGKQRMLTQKMSKEYFLVALGFDVENNKLNLLDTYSLFDQTLSGLRDGDDILGLPATTQAPILEQLKVVEGNWSTFKVSIAKGADATQSSISDADVRAIAEGNLPLLKEMNAAVKFYEQEAAK